MPELNFFDRAIAAVAPRAAAKRLAARIALDGMQKRGYDGASRGRRTDGWSTGSASADTEIANAGATLRARMRDLVRNNPHAARAVSAWVEDIVGDGFTPYANTGSPELDERIDGLWARFADTCDADGLGDFNALTTLAVREMVESGEVLTRRRRRRGRDNLPVPLQIQMMEIDHLDESRLEAQRADGDGRTVRGIVYNNRGQRTAYWLFPDHPGDIGVPLSRTMGSLRVPADGVIHLFRRDRVQQRGVPWGAPVIMSLRDLDDWQNAELVRKKTEACVVGIVFGADEAEQGIAPSVTDADGNIVERFEPGIIAYSRGGKDIKFNSPSAAGGISEWLKVQLHIIAEGWNLPYERLTGDLRDVSYISGRLGRIDHQRAVGAYQWQLVIPNFCQPIWNWFTEAAYLAGEIPEPRIPVEWQPSGFAALDPAKEVDADLKEVRMGVQSLPKAIAKRGYNPKAMLKEIAETNAMLDEMGIVLDSDPRRVSQQGQAQRDEAEPPETGDN